jgi:hypothetical protein
MKKITITKYANRFTADATELIMDYKNRGLSKFKAWDQFIIDRNLRPEMDAKEFYALYDNTRASSPIDKRISVDFEPTHLDTLVNMPCQITDDDRGVHHIIWECGVSGTHPPIDSTFYDRFIPINESPHDRDHD